ncbi:LysR family transcriptional regulator [Streptomyces catenulae]|uniref:LysR family transcriptional regulator n=1 Tax=Streptomyces catenulae TaxID=66875 RepID=A0ABV2Z4F9_9ACTN|nr:LysR family transcriptional regulator [Streptomyces catenulae]
MGSPEIREVEAFLALAEELHFRRAGERLHISQSRISQLLRTMESRVGARLVERTSRRVRLTPLGEMLFADLRPAYNSLQTALDTARTTARGVGGLLRIGFQGTVNDHVMKAIALFQNRHPECTTEIVEIPFSDPFGPLQRHEVDTAVVLLPVEEDDLVLGQVFSKQPQALAVSVHHRFASHASLTAEDLAECPLISVRGAAPEYWRRAQAPSLTPGDRVIPAGPLVSTLQEGLALVAADRGAMLLCHPTAEYYGRRDIIFVPLTGLEDSFLGLVWRRSHETARVRAFSQALAAAGATIDGPPH